MEISKNFQHPEAEQKWYEHWVTKGYFKSVPDGRPPYTVVMPPPNVTGVLHMGHALNNTVQDCLVRRAKMKGFNTCWVPGTDHASIATEAKVTAMLREQGIDKNTLSREEFLKYAWQWKDKYGGIILKQLEKLGCSIDWDRTTFTLDPDYTAAVIHVFVDLYNKGFIYRGVKIINWDPKAQTALSDEEVNYRGTQSKLFYVKYRIDSDTEEYITIATVRPETILGDTAVCVHPEDDRYRHLHGKYCFVPLVNRRIPIICDTYIDREFGTGALKVTPAHDVNDYNLGLKHHLQIIDTLNPDGTMSEAAGMFVGEDRFAVRKKIVVALQESGNLAKEEAYTNQVGYSERTDAVIEPRLSVQWWCNMQTLATPAIRAVADDVVAFHPTKYKNVYRHWMEGIKDWCISRQLWWGHRIPAWYDAEGNIYVAENKDFALQQFQTKRPELAAAHPELRQEEDVLDTWFSSWLWPLQVFGWHKNQNNAELKYYYPTDTLVTAPEIIFFWVARMVMAGYEFANEKPFKKVYFTGIVRDKLGRKMSKQLGNSPDLLHLIEQNGTDAVRFSVMISSPAGNDLLYDEAQLEQGRNFCNKMWNAMKLVKGWENRISTAEGLDTNDFALRWFEARLRETAAAVNEMFEDFRLSEALKTVYSLIWSDFCSWYLEWVKPALEQSISNDVYHTSVQFFEAMLQLLHPFMPFVTEEVYHVLRERSEGDDLVVKPLPEYGIADSNVLQQGNVLQEVITAIRDTRNKMQLKPKEKVQLSAETQNQDFYLLVGDIIKKQVNAETLEFCSAPIPGAVTIVVGTDKLYMLTEGSAIADNSLQKEQMQKELEYLQGFVASIDKKLSNENFVKKAKPEVIAHEQKKYDDGMAKIKTLQESLSLMDF
jgi:valyl-tRNA synthetase